MIILMISVLERCSWIFILKPGPFAHRKLAGSWVVPVPGRVQDGGTGQLSEPGGLELARICWVLGQSWFDNSMDRCKGKTMWETWNHLQILRVPVNQWNKWFHKRETNHVSHVTVRCGRTFPVTWPTTTSPARALMAANFQSPSCAHGQQRWREISRTNGDVMKKQCMRLNMHKSIKIWSLMSWRNLTIFK